LKEINQILKAVTLIGYFLPLAIVIFRKIWKDAPVLMFSCYWALAGLLNVIGTLPFTTANTYEVCRMTFNIIDVPFVLFIFYLNTEIAFLKSAFRILIPAWLLLEIANGLLRGFDDDAFKYFLGAGVVLVIFPIIVEIVHYFQKLNHSGREKALGFLYLAVLFEYTLYIVYYLYEYFFKYKDINDDRNLVYDWSTVIGICIACVGFLSNAFLHKDPPQKPLRRREVLINIID
jgi:hypothetical protein